MAIFTFTTDLGTTDYYVAALKGRIVSSLPHANIIDISNNVAKFDHLKAAYIIKQAAPHFPAKTIHIVGVNDFKSNANRLLVAHYLDQYFVSYDTGFFSLLMDDLSKAKLFEIATISNAYNNLMPFQELIDVALKVAANKPLPIIGTETKDMKKQFIWQPQQLEKTIIGNIIYVDEFENIVTNISQDLLAKYLNFKSFEIQFHLRKYAIRYISKSYADVGPGDLVAIINYAGYLEIAINQGQAAKLLGLKIGEKINIEFTR
jgi:S-adenosyl-L-methionine hydrolase (adenosine-forming)